MKCPNCQMENREGARFCSECGENLEIIGTAAHGLLGMVLTGTGHLSNGVERLEDVRKTFFEKNRRCLYAASENTLGRVYFEIAHGTAPKDPWMIARNQVPCENRPLCEQEG